MKNKFIYLLFAIVLIFSLGCNKNTEDDGYNDEDSKENIENDNNENNNNPQDDLEKDSNGDEENNNIQDIIEDDSNDNEENNNNDKLENIVEEVLIKYSEEDLQEIALSINDKDVTLDISDDDYLKTLLLSLELKKNSQYDESVNRTSKYVLTFSDYEFTIYDDKTICYIDAEGEYDYLLASNNAFDYLDTLYDSVILDFNKYSEDQIIRVFNSLGDLKSIENKTDFLKNLKKVKYFKLNNQDDYQLGDLIYQIQIDEELIDVYSNYIVIDDKLYIFVEGDFSFLNAIKFDSSSGWLPWV